MTIGQHQQELDGLPVFDFDRFEEGKTELPEPGAVAWRLAVESYESKVSWPEAFTRFAGFVDISKVRALVVGCWKDLYETGPDEVTQALLGVRDQMPALRALFIGDVIMEECEISWIVQSDLTPLLEGLPQLETFVARGGNGLEFTATRHEKLRSLTVETGGMPADAVRGIAASDFPALEHLDLWLGTSEYGGDSDVPDLAPFFAGTRLPALRSLALRNSELQDGIADAVAAAPVVARLEVIDLSMGVLTDEGATALLGGQPLTHLKKLDLHHNYLSDGLKERIKEALEPAGVQLDLGEDGETEEEDEDGTVWRFVAVGE
jgi:hypothetical protein